MAVCFLEPVLSAEGPLLYKAEAELKESESNKQKALENLQKALLKATKSGLHTSMDESFLLLFLRARKFKSSKAFNLIRSYYTVKYEHRDIFGDFAPYSVRRVFEERTVLPLPRVLPLRPLAILVRVANWDVRTMSLADVFKGMLITIEHIVRRDVTNQVCGYNFIFDMEGLSLAHVTQFTPMFASRAMSMLENVFPARVKGLHHINVPSIVEGVFHVFRPFLSEKMKKRFAVTSSAEFLFNTYPDEEIPDYLGGQLDTKLAEKVWLGEILSPETNQDFLARSLWGFKEAIVIESTKKSKSTERYDCEEW